MPSTWCHVGKHWPKDSEWVYTLNPEGGYDMGEVNICRTCLHKPHNKGAMDRLIECAGFTRSELNAQ